MTSRLAGYGHRAPRIARRRAIVFSVLVGITMILMIASATAPVAEVQRGLAFALSPFAEAVNGVGREVRSVVDAAAEIDRHLLAVVRVIDRKEIYRILGRMQRPAR